jgi:hypothetical protein
LVGILEQFEDSLDLFEKVLPSFFRGAMEAAGSEFAQIAMNTTRTKDKKSMSNEAREFLQTGPLKYEVIFIILKNPEIQQLYLGFLCSLFLLKGMIFCFFLN